jgi:hypothetical protein
MRLSAAGAWLLETASDRRESQCPISCLFEGSESSVSHLLPYAPEDLQCTVCFADLLTFVIDTDRMARTCGQGHLLCTHCWRRISSDLALCPTCKDAGFYPVPLLKRLAQNSFQLCPFGCGESVWGQRREKHLKEECPDRPCVCPICEADCKAKDFLAHCHRASGHFSEVVSVDLRELQEIGTLQDVWHRGSFLLKVEGRALLHVKRMRLQRLQPLISTTDLLLSLELEYLTEANCCQRGARLLLTKAKVHLTGQEGSEFCCAREVCLPAWEVSWCGFVIPPFGDQEGSLCVSFV